MTTAPSRTSTRTRLPPHKGSQTGSAILCGGKCPKAIGRQPSVAVSMELSDAALG
jgi:hypothetical protein